MKKTTVQLISILLAALMLLSVFAVAFADGEDTTPADVSGDEIVTTTETDNAELANDSTDDEVATVADGEDNTEAAPEAEDDAAQVALEAQRAAEAAAAQKEAEEAQAAQVRYYVIGGIILAAGIAFYVYINLKTKKK